MCSVAIVIAHVIIQSERAVLALNARIIASAYIVRRYREVSAPSLSSRRLPPD